MEHSRFNWNSYKTISLFYNKEHIEVLMKSEIYVFFDFMPKA